MAPILGSSWHPSWVRGLMLSETFLRQAGLRMLGRTFCADKDSLDRGLQGREAAAGQKFGSEQVGIMIADQPDLICWESPCEGPFC